MNITLSADKTLIKKAREYASKHDTSLNKMVRAFLQSIVSKPDFKKDLEFFLNTVERIQGNSNGKTWTREEIYER